MFRRHAKDTAILYAQQARAERLIAIGRAILAGFSLVAIRLDPSEPSSHAGITYTVLSAYVVYAVVLAVVVLRAGALPGGFGILSHVFDMMIFSIIMSFTLGPGSPFFVFLYFRLCAQRCDGSGRAHCGPLLWP
jgi:hypothetical protein